MTTTRVVRIAAFGCVAVMLVVLGAALRPLIIAEQPAPAEILSDNEIGFVHDMVAHHQQALFIAQRLNANADPAVSRLAQQIDDSQRSEVGMMLGWLRLANVTPGSRTPMDWMHTASNSTDLAAHHGVMRPDATTGDSSMPGMATMAELDALTAATGVDAEVLFLQLMERHHRGGIVMAQAANELLADGPVKQSARDMITTQSQESGLMALMLAQRGAQPLG
ncbi:DUF305 domain-containing protein [Rhodococcus sp. 24CO]|uniref:DUF305 domain-containing protein n=1 Tax=Rhodococcus sp. 24CO TaxID=3117460 RepID=UPI003D358455